ncbi:cupin domain-containing protein [Leptospira barantonii]|uniref:ChrR-like cupin domain-containing protein n=1 Tax=Leptospira barantonii TaxID=2023184 RepID=A0ABX4NIK5_9LEPT|nr:cupin domain-containing protein [Leptospira barantonii]PJZ55497.1 hypothetical protein CH367_20055 [Leptospira barantonii]
MTNPNSDPIEPAESWEDFVFPKEVFSSSKAELDLEDVFHLYGLSSMEEFRPHSSLRNQILSKVLQDPTDLSTTGLHGNDSKTKNAPKSHEDFLFVRKSEESLWKKSAFEGVEYKILNRDSSRNTVTLMIRMEPGAVFPAHPHGSAEDCFLVSGDLMIAGTTMSAGDFHRAEAGSKHKKFTTSLGAEFLIVSGESDFSESEKFFS